MEKHNSYHRAPSKFIVRNNTQEKTLYKGFYYGELYDKMFEKSRFNYINSHINYYNKSIIDIGCNTGFFLFEALDNGATKAEGYEGSKAAFELLNKYVKSSNYNISINNNYYSFNDKPEYVYDVAHLLNVVHHFGADYGETLSDKDLSDIKDNIISQINSMAYWSKHLVLQMGFNLHGNLNKPIFNNGTKKEMIDFITAGTKQKWQIMNIGVARSDNGYISYGELNDENIQRDDKLGEFLNRPIFIMKSLI
ncbi:hypothetical protein ACGK9R_01940 [Halomonas sp. HNIBRBA4712]|uniref:hypothetical protein n=1 Tax=Halomonas sp. HNIBRBA4712 TaxID=3373087 RepID=UPI00374608AC